MRIGVDIRCLLEARYSGISEYTLNLLSQLISTDQDNRYILFYNSSKKIDLELFKLPNVEVADFHYPNKFFNLAIAVCNFKRLDEMVNGVDVWLTPSFIFSNLSKKCKKVLIVHDISFEHYPEFFTWKKLLWHKLIRPKKMCQQADRIIAISKHTKNDIVRTYGINEEKISVITPGIHHDFFNNVSDPQLSSVRTKYKLPAQYILYLGNIEPRKNILTLLQAFDEVSHTSAHLVLAGSYAWKYKKITRYVATMKKKNLVHFLGYVDKDDKPALYKLATIFCYPSIYEGFGLPPIEAMAAGTPVICSVTASLPEAVGDAALLINPYDGSELTHAIEGLLIDKEITDSYRFKGTSRAMDFQWDKRAKEIKKLLTAG